MGGNNSFKNWVKETIINQSRIYNSIFVENQYLICSHGFVEKDCYILSDEKNNFLHLVGVHTNLSPDDFFIKCFNESLTENDFDFNKNSQTENSVKGSVRRKIKSLEKLETLFEHDLLIEEGFKKYKISCAIATTDK